MIIFALKNMLKMKKLLIILFGLLMFAGCDRGFSLEERDLINGGEGVMRVTSIANAEDSLLLRKVCKPLNEKMTASEEFSTLCRRMLLTVQDPANDGVGIAAPQVGILRREVAVQRYDKEGYPFEFFVNPEIVEYVGEMKPGGEGCLSVPDMRGVVSRAQSIVLKYRDKDFVEHTDTIEGFTAVIFQHEIDHLDGVLYIDKMEK